MPDTPSPCHELESDLSALLDDELAPARAQELRAHLGACPGCSEKLARLARVDSALSAAPAPAVPALLRARLQARLASGREAAADPARPLRNGGLSLAGRWRAAGFVGAVAAGLGVFYLAFGRAPVPLDLQTVPEDELGLALEIETADDLEVIGNLEVLELVLASESS